MAFDTDEKAIILYHLGYPAKVVDPNSIEYNSIVNDRFENFPSEFEDIVRGLIDQIAATKLNITSSQGDMRVKQVGDIVLNSDNVSSNLKIELKNLYVELSNLMNITYRGRLGNRNVRVVY